MDVTPSSRPPKTQDVWDLCRIYGIRVARLCFLKMRCGDHHMVTLTERELISIAERNLKLGVVSAFNAKELNSVKDKIHNSIRIFAEEKLRTFDLDDEERDRILRDVQSFNTIKFIYAVN